jgi:hypothetical protein
VLEDEAGLRDRDLGPRAELVDDEGPERLGVADSDVHQEVVGTGEEVHVQDLGPCRDVSGEGGELLARARLHPHRDHGAQAPAERGRVDVRVEAPDDAGLAQEPHARQAGRRRDTDGFRQRVVGHAAVAFQQREKASVDVVERWSAAAVGSQIVRCIAPVSRRRRRVYGHEVKVPQQMRSSST